MEEKLEETFDTISVNLKLQTFLLKLSDTLRPLDNPVDIEEAVTKIALDFMEADRCHYGSIEGDNIIILQDASRENLPTVSGVHTISSFAMYKAALNAGVPFVVDDVRINNLIDEELKKLCLQSQYGSFINVPVIKNEQLVGLLSLVQSKPRKWTDAEVQITIETAERTWVAVERAKAEEALRQSDEKYRSLFNSILDAFCIIEMIFNEKGEPIDWIYVETNPAFSKHATVEMKGKRISEIVPEMEEFWLEKYGGVAKTGQPVQLEHIVKGLGNQWFQTSAFSHGPKGSNRVAVLFRNITERKQAEEKIKESESRFHTMADASPVLIWTISADGLSSYYNKTFLDFIGVSKGEDISDWEKIVHPDDVRSTIDTINIAISERRSYSLECRLLRADGQWRWVLAQGNPNIGADNEFMGFVGSSVDITERKEAEEKVKESEHELRKIKEQLELSITAGKIGVWHWDVNQDTLYWSEEQKLIYGLEPSAELLNVAQYRALVIPEDWERLNKVLQSASLSEDQEYDFRIIRKNDGEIRWIKSRARNILDPQGAIQFISGVNIDVTEQVIALTKLQASEEKFKRLVLQAPVAICVLRGKDYVIETMNDGMCALWDRTLAQALNKPVFDVLPEVKDQGIKELLDNVYFTGERCVIQELSVNIRRNDKLENAFVKLVYEPLREADGTISGVMALAHEITEQVMARKKVEESEKRFEAAILAVEGIIWTSNAQGEMIGKQPGWAKLTGQHFEEYQGYGWAKAIHPDDAQPTLSAWTDAVNNQKTFEFEHRVKTKQNDWRLFSVKAVPAFDKTGAMQQWIGVHTDITEQKLAEEKLTYRTALLEAHNQASVDGILLVDAKGKIISFNQCFIEIWNMPQHIVDAKDDEAALSFAMTQLVNPQLFIDKVKYHYEHPTEMCLDELDFKDGKIVERNGYPVIGDDGTHYAWSWTFRDITEQKNYEKIIIESEQRFRTLAETLPQLIWMTNEKGAYEYASSHWINYSGLDPYAGDTWEKLVHPHDLESLAQGWESSLKTGKTFNSEARLKNKNGMYSWHLVQGEPIKSEQGTIIKWIGAFTDIENLKEEQKQKNDFLSMASHELRTPVTTIKGYGQIIERLLAEKNDLKTLGFVKKMTKQVNRLDTLITDLLDITKMQRGGLIRNESVFNFNDLVKEVVDDMQKTTVTHQIIDNLNADLEIKGDKDKLSQVLNNLISNATKYSPAADKIIVSTQIVKDGVQLSVQDFGIGISIEGQQRVFEQFYRVDGENQSTFQGMGIGLYICAEIIKKEGGNIWVESTGGEGSVFYVWLPVDHNDGTEGQ